ncbi:mucin-2-like isoform X3 [Neoarius graeffei]|uniref:mucin-2-like isoform X3 n=1 Tax=Neoarius graeffei TaxID=443677 RepID=UPI00298D425F|nr:mucin-2-like isoform X3 [Neoarius graeffei]
MAALVLLFFFHLILDIRSQNVPQLLVSPEVLTERGSVELHCSVPHNVKVSRCSFYPEGDDTNVKSSPSCRLSVTGSDLIRWTGRRSPGTLQIICFYVLDNSVRSPSPHSRPAPVTVLSFFPSPTQSSITPEKSPAHVPQLLVSPEVLTERGSVELHCSVPNNVKVSRCSFYPEGDDTFIKLSPSPSCRLSVTGSDLIRWTGRSSPETLRIICFYVLDNSVRSPSPHSRPAPVTVLNQKPKLSVVYDDQLHKFTFSCEIPGSESVTADLSCNLYTGEKTQFFSNTSFQKRDSGKAVCVFIADRNDVFNRQPSVKSREVSCDYSVTSDPTARSPMSEKYNTMRFFPSPTQSSITPEKSPAHVPQLLVSPEVLTERGSVELHCSVPHNVKVSRCSFYPEGDDTNIKPSPSPSCRLSVTGSDLIRWTGRSSPGTLRIICFYVLDNSDRSPSPHSRPAPVTVLSKINITPNQKPKLSVSHDNQSDEFRFSCEIPGSESVTADLSCNLYTGEKTQFFLKTSFQKRDSGKVVCVFIADRNDVFNRLQSVKSRKVSCDYSVTSDPTARSPMSKKYNMMHFFPETPQRPTTKPSPTVLSTRLITTRPTAMSFSSPSTTSSTTKEKTRAESHGPSTPTTDRKKPTAGFSSPSTTSSTTKEKTRAESHGPSTPTTDRKKPTAGSLLVLLLSVLSVCVLLAGMMSVCLCSFIRKQTAERRKMDLAQGVLSMHKMKTSGSEDPGTYSVISSVPSPSLLLESSSDRKEDSVKPEDDGEHVYCFITDTQVGPKDKGAVYSLLQMH